VGILRQHHLHVGAVFAQSAHKFRGLVRGDAAGHAK
jgi:hypothetical protein